MATDSDDLQAPRRHWAGTAAAWVVILAASALMVGVQYVGPRPEPGDGRLGKAVFRFQSKYLVGAAQALGDRADEAVQPYLEPAQTAGEWQRVRVAVLAGELLGPDAALEILRAEKEPSQPEEASQPAAEEEAKDGTKPSVILVELFEDYSQDELSAPSVSESQRRRLEEQLGWFGKLALAPPGSESPLRREAISAARHTFYTIIGGFVTLGILGLAGLFVLIVFLALLLGGGLTGLDLGSGNGGVYAEAFAFWLVLFLALNVAGGLWLGTEGLATVSLLALAVSLLAIVWPLGRGVSWQQLRQDLGWTAGRGLLREVFAGIGAYAMAIPLVIVAILLTSVAVGMGGNGAESGQMPVHPLAEWIAEGSWWDRVQLVLLACLAAPIVEETMFRGFLYRHLREATGSMSRRAGVLLSAIVTSLLFAVVHPQGLLAAPAIVGIALALAFMREWRKTLLPSILAHALNNAVMMAVLIALLTA